jgi:acyl-coenzyme A synthetase/AMP-(fatty) acid ligase
MLEHRIRLLPAVVDAVVVDDRCYVEHGRDADSQLAERVRALAAELGRPEPAVVCAPGGSLPRTPSGKIRRVALPAVPGAEQPA